MTQEPSIAVLRLMLRAANTFMLEVFDVCRGWGDFTDTLIVLVLVASQSTPLGADVALQRRYAGFDQLPPDELRRAISVNALSLSLGLPFETVRRRVRDLVKRGVCEIVPEGVRLTVAAQSSPAHRQMLEDVYALTERLYRRLRAAGCLPPAPAYPGALHAAPPVRIVWRATARYTLRLMELLLPNFINPVTTFIALAVARTNTAALPDAEWGAGAPGFIPDTVRRPARAGEIAALLGLPYETTRRHLAGLVEDGRCVRVGGGVIVPARELAKPRLLAALHANMTNVTRMFALLAETGVLAAWDVEEAGDLNPRLCG